VTAAALAADYVIGQTPLPLVVGQVHAVKLAPLTQVGLASNGFGLSSDPLECRQQQCHQQRNYGNNHQKLDQCKASPRCRPFSPGNFDSRPFTFSPFTAQGRYSFGHGRNPSAPPDYLSHLGIIHNPNAAILIISDHRQQVNYFIDVYEITENSATLCTNQPPALHLPSL
jgi:hypothetical protein